MRPQRLGGDDRGPRSGERLVDRLAGRAVVQHRPAHALDRLLRAVDRRGVLVAARDRPERGLLAVAVPVALALLAHRVPAGLVLPVVVAAAEHQPLLGPDDLRADGEAAGDEALGDGGRRAARRARHRRPRRGTAPRPRASRPGRRSAPCRCAWSPTARRVLRQDGVVVDAIGRVGRPSGAAARRPAAAPRRPGRWRCRRAADAARGARGRLPGKPEPRAAPGVSSSRGSASAERSSASISAASKPSEPRSTPSSAGRPPRAPAAPGPSRPARRAGCRRGCRPASALSLRWPSSITGTAASPSFRAASTRPWPAMMPFVAVDQHRVGEAELADRAGDQRHLRSRCGCGRCGRRGSATRSGGSRSRAARRLRSGAGGRASRAPWLVRSRCRPICGTVQAFCRSIARLASHCNIDNLCRMATGLARRSVALNVGKWDLRQTCGGPGQ